ncbi:hypothetical protein FA09DRAFT_336352 [Tilletiopsis washingtonensis]|jgi:hypothetical protein|uniref:Uncharacterized protein n=1 Tax=Tilletiopsis washingtonensis TaxID=58919 RepID=A0A316ZHH3_9BASI|nr:hypothetical protein FA09DRAFT_336352 [Tilletiopsis washingtonensis]PWO00962.1 hypothetical protein FA09DRAFT_336352 [Tilletiopsis washingtonensis]
MAATHTLSAHVGVLLPQVQALHAHLTHVAATSAPLFLADETPASQPAAAPTPAAPSSAAAPANAPASFLLGTTSDADLSDALVAHLGASGSTRAPSAAQLEAQRGARALALGYRRAEDAVRALEVGEMSLDELKETEQALLRFLQR